MSIITLLVIIMITLLCVVILKSSKKSNFVFVKDNLLPNEQILVTAEWHWMKYLFPVMILLVLSIALLIGSYYEGKIRKENQRARVSAAMVETIEDHALAIACSDEVRKTYESTYKEIMQLCDEVSPWDFFVDTTTGKLFILCIVLLPLSFFISKSLSKFDEFAITNLRVVAEVGFIHRIAFELHNEQMESIGIYQGILGRISGYGTLVPGGVGASKVLIRFVKDPFEFRQHFYDLKKGQQVTQN